MMNRRLLTLVLLSAVIGCKKSAPTPSATAAASPTPAAQAQKPASPPTPSAQAEMVPVKAFQVKLPASFSGDELPQGPVEFALAASAGELLFLKTKEIPGAHYNYGGANRYSVLVRRSQPGSPTLEALQEGGTCTNNSLYALPQTGTYKVLFAPLPGEKHGIDLAVLSSNDPIVNPGIKPAEVSIDFNGLALKKQFGVVPLSMAEGCLNDSWPSHLAVQSNHFELHVMQVAGYKEVFPDDKSMARLEAALQPEAKPVDSKNLPYANSGDAGTGMSARPELLKGEGWSGWRWIEGQSQDGDYPAHVSYAFEGITTDGRFFLVMRATISHPEHKRLFPKAGQSNDSWGKQETAKRLQLEKSLAAADPASFQPNLDQLDAVIRSLKLKQ